MNAIHTLLLLGVLASSAGCVSSARSNQIPFGVRSDPPGCPIEVNGVSMGVTPTTIYLGASKSWVGLFNSPDGWEYGNQSYTVRCLPPVGSGQGMVSQDKIVQPGTTPNGAEIFFNMQLRPYVHPQHIDVRNDERSNITIKRAPDGISDASARLEKLKQLKQDGLITDDEYQAKRKAILDDL